MRSELVLAGEGNDKDLDGSDGRGEGDDLEAPG